MATGEDRFALLLAGLVGNSLATRPDSLRTQMAPLGPFWQSKMGELTMSPTDRLDSWKEVAAYLGCGVRTVRLLPASSLVSSVPRPRTRAACKLLREPRTRWLPRPTERADP